MDITYLGHSSFKIKTRYGSVVTDPFDTQAVGLKFPALDAEIVTISHQHNDHNNVSKISGVKKIIAGPGEYEISGVSIMGYSTFHDGVKGDKSGKNTVYVLEVEGLRIAHLGDLGHPLGEDLIDEMGDIDILMIPVGGFYTIGPKEATEIITKIEPHFVIPMHYKVDGMSDDFESLAPVDEFLKESGLAVERFPKFLVKKEDISEEQTAKIIVLEKKSA